MASGTEPILRFHPGNNDIDIDILDVDQPDNDTEDAAMRKSKKHAKEMYPGFCNS